MSQPIPSHATPVRASGPFPELDSATIADLGADLLTRKLSIRELAEKVAKIVEKTPGIKDVNSHVLLGNPDIVVKARSAECRPQCELAPSAGRTSEQQVGHVATRD